MRRLIAAVVLCLGAWYGDAAPNPVLPGVADSGVMRFNGAYYVMGTGTSGQLYVSDDLVHWRAPVHAFSMNNAWAVGDADEDSEIHACDVRYDNGLFHLYWSVNHQELRQIGHAIATYPTGPYRELSTDRPFDGRIDPHVFVDRDGRAYFYTVKFTDGNVIWGQSMADLGALSGEPRELMTAIPDTWEWQDHRVNEAPWVVRHRDRYYMLYNANHTGERYGHYAIGAAEASAPLSFSNDTKYGAPVLDDNRARVLGRAEFFVAPSIEAGVPWRYTTSDPRADWVTKDFDDGDWEQGYGSFGNPEFFMPKGTIRTAWSSREVWLRKRFRLAKLPSPHVQVLVNHDDAVEVHLNGVKAYAHAGVSGGYGTFDITPAALGSLRVGDNVLAVHASQIDGPQYIDASLIDPIVGPGEAIITNCGQPSLVRGPNAFEWWCVYFAKYNGGPRSQAVDRAHFLDRRLYVEGPTGPHTPGYHPSPAPPTFGALFNEAADRLDVAWTLESGEWQITNGEFQQAIDAGECRALANTMSGSHFLVEAGLRFLDPNGHRAGMLVRDERTGNEFIFGLDRTRKVWFCTRSEGDESTELTGALDPGFAWDAYHSLRITRNADEFRILLNDQDVPGVAPLRTRWQGPARPGLVTSDAAAAFDAFVYTIGWDEWDTAVRGWKGPRDTGAWQVEADGLRAMAQGDTESRVLKGDLLDAYEFSAQVFLEEAYASNAYAGLYVAYVDAGHHLRAVVVPEEGVLRLIETHEGQPRRQRECTIPQAHVLKAASDVPTFNLRCVKLADRVILFLDGIERITLPGSWPPARVGLAARNTQCRFNGLTLFHRPAE
jgi:glycosyl hydrolase family 43